MVIQSLKYKLLKNLKKTKKMITNRYLINGRMIWYRIDLYLGKESLSQEIHNIGM